MDDTRNKILNAAGPVFADKGFGAATVREICQAADVNLASINYHFGDKEKLYSATVTRAHQLVTEQVPLPNWPQDASPEERLRGFIRTLLERMIGTRSDPWQSRLMMREILQPTDACRAMARDHFRPHFKLLLDILSEMLPARTPDACRHQIVFSIIGQCLYYRTAGEVVAMLVSEQEHAACYSVEQLADHISRFSLRALGRTAPLGRAAEKTEPADDFTMSRRR